MLSVCYQRTWVPDSRSQFARSLPSVGAGIAFVREYSFCPFCDLIPGCKIEVIFQSTIDSRILAA